ncbi:MULTISPECIES: hypothetical protein [unclassified Legionella]|uniref:hypothetical protein n=1 Tax=unclassified Legionella TaxID=2622702 RepID=UPI001E339B1D|nr:hypothetical protein [Legionella sp. 31fI33]MCC5015954.1 hypothetical protein [Legionella sp. 31fI33]
MKAKVIVYREQKEGNENFELMAGHLSLVMNILNRMDSTQLTQDLLSHLTESSHFLRESLNLADNQSRQVIKRASIQPAIQQARH